MYRIDRRGDAFHRKKGVGLSKNDGQNWRCIGRPTAVALVVVVMFVGLVAILPRPVAALTGTLSVDVAEIHCLDDIDFLGLSDPDWYLRIDVEDDSSFTTKRTSIPIEWNACDIDPTPLSVIQDFSFSIGNPTNAINVWVELWDTDGSGGSVDSSDDAADISREVGGGCDDCGGGLAPSGSYLHFEYYVFRPGSQSDHVWIDDFGATRSAGSYYNYYGDSSPDSSTGIDENDAWITLTIEDDVSTPSPGPPTISSPTHSENVWSNNNDPSFTWTVPSDRSGIYGYSYILNTSPSTTPDTTRDTGGTSRTYTNVADGGNWYFHVRAVNNAMVWGSADHFGPIKIDTGNPPAPIISLPTHSEGVWSNNNDLSFTWTVPSDMSGIERYFYARDTSPTTTSLTVSTTSTSKSYMNVPDGDNWYFHVRALDNAGNLGDTDHFGPIKIDTQNPSIVLISSPTHSENVWSNNNDPSFTWTASDPPPSSGIAGFSHELTSMPSTIPDCIIDTSGLSASFIDVPNGDWYFHVRALDDAGNCGDTNHFGPVRIDTDNPSSPTISSPTHSESVWTNNNDPSFTWTVPSDLSGISGYSYAWDTSPSTAPDTSADTGGTSQSYTNVADGDNWYFHVRALDNAGNWGNADHFGPIKIDTELPSGTITINSGDTWTNSISVTLTLTYSDSISDVHQVRYRNSDCSFGTELWESPSTSKAWTLTSGDGTKTVCYQIEDNAGNTFETPPETIVLDTTEPISAVDSPLQGSVQTSTSFLTSWDGSDGTGSDIVWFDLQYKDGSTGTWTDWLTQTGLKSSAFTGVDGHTYYFQSRALDNAGNLEAYPGGDGDTYTTIDLTADDINGPDITNLQPPDGSTTNDDSPTISADYSDSSGIDTGSVLLKVDGVDVTSSATVTSTGVAYTPTTPLSDGPHDVYLEVQDNSSNHNSENKSWSFDVDTTGPDITNLQPPDDSTTNDDSPTISADYSDPSGIDTSSVLLKVDGIDVTSSATVTTTGVTYTPAAPLSDGSHDVYLEVEDSSGNQNSANESWSFDVDASAPDTTPPSSSVVTPIPGSTQATTSFAVSWSGFDDEGGSGLKWFDIQYKDGELGTWTDWLTQTDLTSSDFTGEDGHTYYFQSKAQDTAGNWEEYPGGDGDTHTTVAEVENPGTIQGHVYTSGTATPIDGASVSTDMGGYSTLTDGSGYYSLIVEAGTYNVTVSKADYKEASATVSVGVNGTQVLDFSITSIAPSEEKSFFGEYWWVLVLIAIAIVVVLLLLWKRKGQLTEDLADEHLEGENLTVEKASEDSPAVENFLEEETSLEEGEGNEDRFSVEEIQ